MNTQIRLETSTKVSDWFPWAEVSVTDADGVAAAAGMNVTKRWQDGDRWFVVMTPDQASEGPPSHTSTSTAGAPEPDGMK